MAHFRHYLTGHRLRAKAKRLDARLAKLNEQRDAEAARRRQVEEWCEQTQQVVLSHFEYYRARAARARLLSAQEQRAVTQLEFDWAAFERNGRPEHAPQSEDRERRAAAISGASRGGLDFLLPHA